MWTTGELTSQLSGEGCHQGLLTLTCQTKSLIIFQCIQIFISRSLNQWLLISSEASITAGSVLLS